MEKKGLPKLKLIVASLKDKSRAGHALASGSADDAHEKEPLHIQAMKEMHQANSTGDHAAAMEAFRALLGHVMSGEPDSEGSPEPPDESVDPEPPEDETQD